MAAIDDLITQIEDNALRGRLREEVDRLTKEKKFGLVFEEHLPELTPIYTSSVRAGSHVALRDAALVDVWRVLAVEQGSAQCVNVSSGEKRQIPTNALVVVRRLGEAIFPTLLSVDSIQNGPDDAPWHTLIEADNFHALQLLEYLYAGQVDCIYIDPPYNTGARDWKYNNDYVDQNDRWRHSKWLAMMNRRLRLAKRLLKPDIGVLIVTVDEHEVHHLGMLLEELFPETSRQMITIVITPGGVTQERFSRVEEYAMYCFNPDAYPAFYPDDLLSADIEVGGVESYSFWESLLRRGESSQREDRPGMFYPIYVDPQEEKITGIGEPLPLLEEPDWSVAEAREVAWPVRSDGSLGRWRIGPESCKSLLASGFLKLGNYDEKRKTWPVQYLQKKTRNEIESGILEIVSRDTNGAVELAYAEGFEKLRPIKTVWNRTTHRKRSVVSEGCAQRVN